MRRVLATSFVALFVMSAAGPASAGPIVAGDTIRLTDGSGTTGGGEFLATLNGGVEQFITFCLQRTEYIDFSNNFVIGGVTSYAITDPVAKGGDALTGQDPLSSQTAWLYTQFRANALTGYDYLGATRWQSANALQNAIWWFEGELTSNPNNAFVTAANTAVAGGWTGLGDVRVLNLYFPNGNEAQDQLALVPPTARAVPEPATLALVGSGLGLGLWRRYRRRNSAK